MISITRRLEFDAGHRLIRHESKCRNVHGHRYRAEVTCSAEALDEVGRVIDFGKVKEIVGTWIDDKWDHGFIYQEGDSIEEFLASAEMKCYMMPVPPTAENMSQELLEIAQNLLGEYGIRVERIRLYETPNCWADAFAGDAEV